MGAEANELINVAREFCDLIERPVTQHGAWLRDLAALLPRLHMAVAAQQPTEEVPVRPTEVDLDQRFELFTRLRGQLGEFDGYWMEFDVAADGQEMSGSLADDLTDIYCELKEGLVRLEHSHDPFTAVQGLRRSFQVHWGLHLLDAERHLYALNAQQGGAWAAQA